MSFAHFAKTFISCLMNFLNPWFPPEWTIAAHIIWAAFLLLTARRAFSAAAKHPAATFVAVVCMAVLWILNADLGSGQLAGMNYHLLGINLVALMLGAPAALWLSTLLLIPYAAVHGIENLGVTSLNALFLLLPALSVNLLLRKIAVRLPPNLFVYIFFNGFISAALGMLLTGVFIVLLLQTAGVFSAEALWSSAFPVFFLLTWGEAFLNGIFTAIFVALRPQWLATFDDARYLHTESSIWK